MIYNVNTHSVAEVLPLDLRRDITVPFGAKLLYLEIKELAQLTNGIYQITKEFIVKVAYYYNVSHQTIKDWYNSLVKNGYIEECKKYGK